MGVAPAATPRRSVACCLGGCRDSLAPFSRRLDPADHGRRAAGLARDLRAEGIMRFSARRAAKLERGCADQADGLVTRGRTISVCWDADRLELRRLGVEPNPDFLSTNAARARVGGSGSPP